MTTNQLKQIKEELLQLKSQNIISTEDKLRIQKLQQSMDIVLNEK